MLARGAVCVLKLRLPKSNGACCVYTRPVGVFNIVGTLRKLFYLFFLLALCLDPGDAYTGLLADLFSQCGAHILFFNYYYYILYLLFVLLSFVYESCLLSRHHAYCTVNRTEGNCL